MSKSYSSPGKSILPKTLIYLALAILSSACNMMKNVPEDKYLLNRYYLKIDNKEIPRKDLEDIIKQKPNKRIFGLFRLNLGLYDLSSIKSKNWLNRSLRKLGEEPVIYDEILKDNTIQQMSMYLKNRSYYNSSVRDTILFRKRKAIISYIIKTGISYKLQKIDYKIDDKEISKILLADSLNCILKRGSAFEVDMLQNERTRIEELLKNKGYYSFSKEYIFFEADSALNKHSINLVLGIKYYQIKNQDGTISNVPHSVYKLGNIKVVLGKNQVGDSTYLSALHSFDTLYVNNLLFIYPGKVIVRPAILFNNIYLTTGQTYCQRDVDETYKSLSSLKIFKFINIVFTKDTIHVTDSIKTIDCCIQLATVDFQSYQTSAELTNTEGFFGVGGSIIYQHKNLLKGAEIFDLKLKGATEAIKKTQSSYIRFTNTLDLGAEAKIQFPKYLLPFLSEQFMRKFNPKTTLSIAYNYLRRPEYAHNLANISFGYSWKGNRFTTYQINPVDVNYVKLVSATEMFKDSISKTYLKYSFLDHFVAKSSFSFTFNNQIPKKKTPFYYFRFNAETAGNSLNLLSKTFHARQDTDNAYQLFNIKFAQFIKGDIDFRYYQPTYSTDKIVYRIFIGVAFPYGNSKTVPFEEQYYSGGANSIRAWQVRNLGPGTYIDPVKSTYPDKTADIKLEANLEYRFKLFWLLEGALFIDAGNIWSINKNDNRTGALFSFNKFIDQIAIGPGFGTRFDFTYFIFRLDLGFKLRDPTQPYGQRWAFGEKISINYFNPTIGIGYPF